MASGGARGGAEGEEFLLRTVEDGDGGGLCMGERPWRLNFDGFRRPEGPLEKPDRGFQHCLGVLAQGTGDVVAEYYQQQLEMLEGFNEMDTLPDRGFLPRISEEERERVARSETLAIQLSNIANMVLFAAKVYESVRSGSLAIIASTLDSLLDLLSGFMLWFTAFSMQTPNPYRYPIGQRRMQPLGILVFASVMATLGIQIILESTHSLVSDDHFFDVITNVIGIMAALLANYVQGWIDPVGAIIDLIDDSARKCPLPGGSVSTTRISSEAYLPLPEPPQGCEAH